MNDTNERQVIAALFRLSRSNQPITTERLAREAELLPREVVVALIVLDRAGLVDLSRLRLTMPGLAIAAGLDRSPPPALVQIAALPGARELRVAA